MRVRVRVRVRGGECPSDNSPMDGWQWGMDVISGVCVEGYSSVDPLPSPPSQFRDESIKDRDWRVVQ